MGETRLIELRRITGQIVVETGLRIGGSQDTMEISGLDNPILRNPANAEPYIPGSSLKGRMRSLAEWYFGEIPVGGDVTKPDVTGQTARVFGIPARDPSREPDRDKQRAYQSGPTRLIVRDAILSQVSRTEYANGRTLTEVKSENSINRLTAVANPRPMERVVPGIRFDLDLVYRVFAIEEDNGEIDKTNFDNVFLVALALVQADALGGGSSRGNGKIRFDNLMSDGQSLSLPTLQFHRQTG